MSDLAEFLLARIAEDEAVLADTQEWWIQAHGQGWELISLDPFDPFECPDGFMIPAARIRAECEAKRRIIGWADAWIERDAAPMVEEVFRLLALPYAEHPAYRQEWRP